MKIKEIYDVILLPHNAYHVWTFALISRELKKLGISSCMFDLTDYHRDEGSRAKAKEFSDIQFLNYKEIVDKDVEYNAVVCLNDWDKTTNKRILTDKKSGKKTIAIIEGINDFLDKDNIKKRNVYKTVEYLFLTGLYDKKFFKDTKTKVVGIPRLDTLLKEPILPINKPIALINVNFTYNVLEHQRDMWLKSAIEGCKKANIDYIITQHPSDTANLSKYNLSHDNIYMLIKNSSIVISRFSSVILESLALGKPVVYHNPHNEQAHKFQEPLGAYSLSFNSNDLAKCLKHELSLESDIRKRANPFLDLHCNINSKFSAAELVAKEIDDILRDDKNHSIRLGSFIYANKLYIQKKYLSALGIYIFLAENNSKFPYYKQSATRCYKQITKINQTIDKKTLERFKKLTKTQPIPKST